jgi:pimeloyl-ACP methyl ester carboxylesterase
LCFCGSELQLRHKTFARRLPARIVSCYDFLSFMRLARTLVFVFSLLAGGVVVSGEGARPRPTPPTDPSTISPVIVIGFVGGFVSHDNMIHSEVQVAAHIRAAYPAGVYAEAFENHKGKKAYFEVLRVLDANHDCKLSDDEKRNARIILYGHSWGGSQAVTLARQLQKIDVPVLLIIQVDSVRKRGQNDAVIPANVAEAANFYQPHGFLHGRTEIRAADPARTKILGNFLFDYRKQPVKCGNDYPWWDRHIAKPHTLIECDPNVWDKLEQMIRAKLPPLASGSNTQ